MVDFLYSIDLAILYFFNHTLSNPALDRFFSILTNVNNWYIAYILLIAISFKYGGRKGKLAVPFLILLIVVTDQLNHNVIKELFLRLRPCNALPDILTPIGCNGTYSFPSNHAVNNFAAATFFFLLYRNLKWVLFITASLVAISRVYIGMHYPSDVAAGAIMGAIFGFLFGILLLRLNDYIEKKKETDKEKLKKA
jgi:undecaprenyl-diphosphatase